MNKTTYIPMSFDSKGGKRFNGTTPSGEFEFVHNKATQAMDSQAPPPHDIHFIDIHTHIHTRRLFYAPPLFLDI